MKKVFTTTALVIITSVSMYVVLHDHFTGRFPWSPLGNKKVIQAKIHSTILGEDRDVIIHLPHGYDSATTYPVMYVLDGSSEDGHIAEKLEVLAAAGYIPKTIVVGIPNMTASNRQQNLTPPFMRIDAEDPTSASGEADLFLLFIESELIPFMEESYGASSVRLLSGNSRGGLLVMYSLLYKPGLFQARFCYSAPFWRQDAIMVSKVSDFCNSIDTLDTFLFMSAGANETESIKNGLEEMMKTFYEKAPTGLTWHSEYTLNATHQDNCRISASLAIRRWGEYMSLKGNE